MAINPNQAFEKDLGLFSSLYEDMTPTDLPEGLSPDNQDMDFDPGSTQTRAGLKKVFATPLGGSPTVVSAEDFPLPSGSYLSIFLDSAGKMYSNDPATQTKTQIDTVAAGVQFKAENAFDKQFYAFFNQAMAAQFSDSPFVGVEIPRYNDGKGNIWRVTQDNPGANPAFSPLQTSPVNLVQSAPTGTRTISAVASGGAQFRTFKMRDPETHLWDYETVEYWTTLVYTCTVAPPASWVGTYVTVTGLSGTNASLANIVGYVQSVSGFTFTFNRVQSDPVNLTAQAGTATLAGTYFSRAGNFVTAYVGSSKPANFAVGLYVRIQNSTGTDILGTNWAIASIGRDSDGLVTIVVSTELTNLPPGTVLDIEATDTANFPNGSQTVYQVVQVGGGTTTFTINWPGTVAAPAASGGNVRQKWSGSFQLLTVDEDANGNWFITYFQLGPDVILTSTGGTPQAQLQSQIPPGPRNAVIMFKNQAGALTGPSVPVQLSIVGGTNLLFAQQIPIGPPGTAQRVIAFTPAYGSSYYYITPAVTPSIAGIGEVLSLGTIVNDNVTTQVILDFSDFQLTAGTQIDIVGNNLFNQIVLAPCIGVIEYQGRLAWWGEINNIKNLENPGFDGGYIAPQGLVTVVDDGSGSGTTVTSTAIVFDSLWEGATIQIGTSFYVIDTWITSGKVILVSPAPAGASQQSVVFAPTPGPPPGWVNGPGFTGGVGRVFLAALEEFGFAYRMTSAAGSGDCLISQPAYQDFYGAPIFRARANYLVRLRASVNGTKGGNLRFNLYSPSLNQSYTSANFLVTGISTTPGWIVAAFSAAMPDPLPADTILRVYLNLVPNGTVVTIDECEFIDADKPVLRQQARGSYFDNPFGYDEITGKIGISEAESFVGAFKARGYLFLLTDKGMFQTQNNGSTEPNDWQIIKAAQDCGCSSPCAVDQNSDLAWWAGQQGVWMYAGGAPDKISQPIQVSWHAINWDAQLSIWLRNDPIKRVLYVGIPRDLATAPNFTYPMNYRGGGLFSEPLFTSRAGQLIAGDLVRKWSRWTVKANCAAMLHRGAIAEMVFGGGNGQAAGLATGFGNLYTLDETQTHDDDYGVIPSYYVPYFHWAASLREQIPTIGLHRLIYVYLTAFVTGVGKIRITPLVDDMGNPWPNAKEYILSPTMTHDLEWGLNVVGERATFKVSVVPFSGTDAAFQLNHMVVAGRREANFPVRGAYL